MPDSAGGKGTKTVGQARLDLAKYAGNGKKAALAIPMQLGRGKGKLNIIVVGVPMVGLFEGVRGRWRVMAVE